MFCYRVTVNDGAAGFTAVTDMDFFKLYFWLLPSLT